MGISLSEQIRFEEACHTVESGGRLLSGIGTRAEGSVHAVLKNFFEPHFDSQETVLGGYIADIVGENGIIEIQTGKFSRLRDKLAAFLPLSRVTVVYPVYVNKRIVYLENDGSVKSRRMSPLKGNAYEIFTELFPIAEFLCDGNLGFAVMLLECDELRIAPEAVGRKKNHRGRLSVCDRIPTALKDIIRIETPYDWQKLIPCLFDMDYTSAELAKAADISRSTAQLALSALSRGGVVVRTGKKGGAYTYRFNEGFCKASPAPPDGDSI